MKERDDFSKYSFFVIPGTALIISIILYVIFSISDISINGVKGIGLFIGLFFMCMIGIIFLLLLAYTFGPIHWIKPDYKYGEMLNDLRLEDAEKKGYSYQFDKKYKKYHDEIDFYNLKKDEKKKVLIANGDDKSAFIIEDVVSDFCKHVDVVDNDESFSEKLGKNKYDLLILGFNVIYKDKSKKSISDFNWFDFVKNNKDKYKMLIVVSRSFDYYDNVIKIIDSNNVIETPLNMYYFEWKVREMLGDL